MSAQMRVFKYCLIFGWIGFLGTALLCFVFPKAMGYMLGPISGFFVLVPASLIFATSLYGIIHLYRTGMRISGR